MITRDNYELVYEELLRELADVDLSRVSADLGVVYQGDQLEMNFLGQCYRISNQGIWEMPMLLVFYDKDAEFPASCKVLFDKSAPTWLDMECLAVLGWILADLLIKISHRHTQTYTDAHE